VRQCHGDLHLRNIVLLDNTPRLFDAIEFDDALACTDVLYDLAFLLMDLIARDLPQHASVVFNEYLWLTADWDGVGLMPLFMAVRATIRAKTSMAAAELTADNGRRVQLTTRAAMYLRLAVQILHGVPARLIAIGGFSGAGKSTLAQRLAARIGTAPGAVVLRSDVIRRQMLGADPGHPLPAGSYTPANRVRVYAELRAHARSVLCAGLSVVVDAVFADQQERDAIESVAATVAVPFTGMWLDASPAVLHRRLRRRRGDVSDATPQVLDKQLLSGCGHITWARIRAAGDPPATERAAIEILGEPQPDGVVKDGRQHVRG
jgi:predicted kinase